MNSRFLLVTLSLCTFAAMASGPLQSSQPLQRRGYEPVESLVDDVDPTATSLRELQSGLGIQGGQETYVYRQRGKQNADRLFYVVPGVVAEFDRSEYMRVEHRGQQHIFQMIPANTVFHLGLPNLEQDRSTVDPPLRLDRRIVTAQNTANIEQNDGAPSRSRAVDWDAYARHRQAQQEAVLRAIDRLAKSDAPSP
ncbi:MAG: hypothetical protein WD294_11760 [Phycisphaeraceae bacterium]